jgi:hypothetical protein
MPSTPILPQDTTIQSTLPIIDAKGGLEVTAIGEVRYQRGYYTRTEVFPVGYTARRKHRSVYGLGFGVQGLGLRVPCRMNGSPQAQVGSFSASPGPSTDLMHPFLVHAARRNSRLDWARKMSACTHPFKDTFISASWFSSLKAARMRLLIVHGCTLHRSVGIHP